MRAKILTVSNQMLSGLLWLIGALLGIYTVYSLHNLSGTIYALFGKDYYTAVVIGQVVAVIFGLAWIVIFIATAEFLIKHSAERFFWRLFAWIFGVELLIILLSLLFG